MFSLIKPYIFSLDPEEAHNLAIKSLRYNFIPENFFKVDGEEILETTLSGMNLKNPIGLAAGFDKSAEVYNSLFKLGYSFVEVGTITPKRQLGNPKPRIFRLEKDRALINRLGFNNDGLEVISKRISNNIPNGTLGINFGPNKDTKNKEDDFAECFTKLYKYSNYLTINISSPNTEGLRDFHNKNLIIDLLDRLNKIKKKLKITKPIFLKLSPDIDDKEISNILEAIFKFNINGIIISNTSDNSRSDLIDAHKNEKGGISGQPLKEISTILIKKFYKETKNKISIIGVGGVDSGESAFEKISAGANAVQLYTGMIYEGPGVVKKIKSELITTLKKEKIKKMANAVGINA
tara:strand:+ start:5627 stop:6673 length:1047 start_codon:yes stop_codon:yes gene_type:complete